MLRKPIYQGRVLGNGAEKLDNIEKFLNDRNSPMHSDIRKTLGIRERREIMNHLRRKFGGNPEVLTEYKLDRELKLLGYKHGDIFEGSDAAAAEKILEGKHLTKEEIEAAQDETDEG